MSAQILSDRQLHYMASPASDYAVIKRAREGILRSASDEVAGMVGLSDNEMAHVLGMTPRNLHRIRPDKTFNRDASERLILFRNLLIHALDTFEGHKETVLYWLRTPLSELNGQAPLEIMDTVTGFRLADDVLGRLDHGILA